MKAEIARGATWMVLFKLIDRSIGLISTVFLARLLVPADFGLVAMAMSIIAFIELATALGFEAALIQRPTPTRTDYDTAWTLNVIVGVLCGAVIIALAAPTAHFYNEPRLRELMFVLAAAWFFSGFENIGTVDFRRQMNFRSEFRLMFSKRLISFVVTLTAAFALRTYWALVLGMITGRLTGVALSYLLHPYRPRFSLRSSRGFFTFSSGMLLNNVLSAAITRAPHYFTGRMLGSQALGAYTVGSELAYLPSAEIVAPINRAVFPGYARLTGDIEALRSAFIDIVGMIILIALPASVGVALVADPLVRVVLGERWLDAVPVIEILAVSGAVVAMTSNNSSAYLALGRTWLLPMVQGVRLAVIIALLLVLVPMLGLVGVAYAEMIAYVASLLVSLPVLFRAMRISLRAYALCFLRPTIASALMAGAVIAVLAVMGPSEGSMASLPKLLAAVCAGIVAYAGAISALWLFAGRPRGPESFIFTKLVSVTERLGRRPPA